MFDLPDDVKRQLAAADDACRERNGCSIYQLPIINAMIFAEGIAGKATMMGYVNTYATGQFVDDVLQLLDDEGGWVLGQPDESPEALLGAYGVLDEIREGDDEDSSYMYARPCVVAGDYAGAIVVMLDNNQSWGEFIGGVLASMSTWDQATRERVMPALGRAVRAACQHGVDH